MPNRTSSILCAALAATALAFDLVPAGVQRVAHAQQDEVAGGIGARSVLVDHGESLQEIAGRELGSAARAAPLADFNRLPVDAVLQPGQRLRIPVHAAPDEEYVRVVFIKGLVEVNARSVERDARVLLGDVLRTGPDGFAALRFPNGTIANLQPDTEVTLRRLACRGDDERCSIELAAERGLLELDVDLPADQPADLRITTPYASAAVRGTEFMFSAEPGQMRIAVSEGEVLTEALGAQVLVVAGFGSITLEGQPPGEPQALLPAPVFRNVPARVSREDRVRWWPLAEVNRYRATLTSDSAGLQHVAGFEPDDTAILQLDGTSPGERYLSVRAVDDDGLSGLTSNTRLVVAAIDEALPVPDVSIERQGEDFLVSVDEPPAEAAGFEIQLATDPAFEDPLAVDVGPTGAAVFRIEVDVVYARARQLDTPSSVSAYGPTAEAR